MGKGLRPLREWPSKETSALDFDDLICEDGRPLRAVARVLARMATQFRFVMVDEYQGTRTTRSRMLVRRLSGTTPCVWSSATPDQSIYEWRGADVRNSPRLRATLRGPQRSSARYPTVVRWPGNHRCRVGRHRPYPEPETINTSGPTARAATASSTFADRRARGKPTSSHARHSPELYVGRRRGGDGRGAVALAPTPAQSRTIEDALMREGVAYKVVGGVRF